MKAIKTENYNTTNAWGFGGGVGTVTYYDNGLVNKKGKAYFRHLPPEKYDQWFVEYPDDLRPIHGKYADNVFIYYDSQLEYADQCFFADTKQIADKMLVKRKEYLGTDNPFLLIKQITLR